MRVVTIVVGLLLLGCASRLPLVRQMAPEPIAVLAAAPAQQSQPEKKGMSPETKQIFDWFNEYAADHGFATHLEDFVAHGSQPDDAALEAFLDQAGFESKPAFGRWREFAVTYGTRRNIGVQVSLDESGNRLWVRLDLTFVRAGFARRLNLMSRLRESPVSAPGEFRMPDGLLGLYLPLQTAGLTDADVHQAIRALVEQAERSAPIWVQRYF